jgi:hypothetical protein
MPVRWQAAGSPAASTVSFFFQPPSGAKVTIPGGAKDPVASNLTTLPTMVWPYSTDQAGTLIMQDDASGQQMAAVAITIHPAQAFALSSFAAHPTATGTWPTNMTMNVSWTYAGSIPAYDTLTVYLQLAGSSQQTILASNVPIAPLSYQVNPPTGINSQASATIFVKDGSTGQTVSASPMITLVPPAGTQPAPSAFQLSSFLTSPRGLTTWQLGSPLNVQWQYAGAIPAYDTLTISLQMAGSSQLIALATNLPVTSLSYSIPAPRGITATTSAALWLKDMNGVSVQLPITLAPVATAPAPAAPVTAPAPAPTPTAVTVSQLAATSLWVNKTALSFTWNFAGTAPGNQFVTLQMVAAGKAYTVTSAPVWVGYKTYQTPSWDWSTILKTTQAVTLTLVDSTSGKPVSNSVSTTVRIP